MPRHINYAEHAKKVTILVMAQVLEGQDGRLRDTRQRNFLTQKELAQMSGLHFTSINKLERGVSKARASTVRKLAKALGVTPQYLAGLTDEPLSKDSSGA